MCVFFFFPFPAGSLVKPKVVRSVHFNPANNHTFQKTYRDSTSSYGTPTPAIYMSSDPNTKEPLSTEFGLCVYRDHQTITVQEMPEKAPAGQV